MCAGLFPIVPAIAAFEIDGKAIVFIVDLRERCKFADAGIDIFEDD